MCEILTSSPPTPLEKRKTPPESAVNYGKVCGKGTPKTVKLEGFKCLELHVAISIDSSLIAHKCADADDIFGWQQFSANLTAVKKDLHFHNVHIDMPRKTM